MLLKETVHPKKDHSIIIYLLHVNLWEFLSSVEHKRREFLTVAIDLYSMDKNTMEVNGCRQLYSSKYLFFVFKRRKKFKEVWNNTGKSKWWTIPLTFWLLNYYVYFYFSIWI